jgi:uncharacterized protein YbjT (DUF2867 family)
MRERADAAPIYLAIRAFSGGNRLRSPWRPTVTPWSRARPNGMGNHRSILLIGATGLVGSECLRLLLESEAFSRVVVLSRRPLIGSASHPKLQVHLVDFDRLTSAASCFGVDQIMCALGTTMKAAGSRRRFRAVDLLYPLTAAHLGVEKRVSHFLLVSSLGADAKSRFFYSRMKGELENAVSELPYRSLTIARPSLLVGKREHFRLAERAVGGLRGLFPVRYRPIHATVVARVLVQRAVADMPGRRVIESIELREMAMNGSAHADESSAVPVTIEAGPQSTLA